MGGEAGADPTVLQELRREIPPSALHLFSGRFGISVLLLTGCTGAAWAGATQEMQDSSEERCEALSSKAGRKLATSAS